jgi:cytidylate kinase
LRPLVVAIDGPSGAGKSTVAKALALRLGIPYIDTGAMYRAIGLAARERGIRLPIPDPAAVAAIARSVRLEVEPARDGTRVLLDGRDVSEAIRGPEVSLYASAVSAISEVRRLLVAQQRRLGRERGGVLEGRDIGTRVFPETPHKFFLTAPLAVRAERRTRELAARGTPQPHAAVLEEMRRRDHDDQTRADSPLTFDRSYVRIDSAAKDAAEVVAEIEKLVRERVDSAAPAT